MAPGTHTDVVIDFYDTHPINEQQILEKLAADGVDLDGLTEDVLQDYDQDHYGGVAVVDTLARAAEISADDHVLDVCSGMGGPARYLAQNYGCRVTGIDLTESRVEGAARLTALAGLDGRVDFRHADALDNPFPDESFDVVIGQEAWGHVPNKPRLIAENVRVARIGGRLAFTDLTARRPLAAAAADRLAREMATVELIDLAGYRALLEAAGCTILRCDDLSEEWTRVLVDRLAMYRGLKGQTVARFGTDHFDKWDATYSFFVGLYRQGRLGGCRFVARRAG